MTTEREQIEANEAESAARARDELGRAHRAKRIVEDEMFVAAIEAMKQRIWQDFGSGDPKDTAGLQILRIRLQCVNDLMSDLRHHVTTGKMAEKKLAEIKSEREWRDGIRPQNDGG